jgi:hypothetical protein
MTDNNKTTTETKSRSILNIPSELRLSQKWDFALETIGNRTAIGFAIAGLSSFVLFSKF